MIIVKTILVIIGIILGSSWLTVLIGAGVKIGLKNYFNDISKKK